MTDSLNLDPWKPITILKDLKHLGKLTEELGELTQICGRIIIQGLNATNPDTGKENKEALEEEIADVLANIALITRQFSLNEKAIHRRTLYKQARLGHWHNQL